MYSITGDKDTSDDLGRPQLLLLLLLLDLRRREEEEDEFFRGSLWPTV